MKQTNIKLSVLDQSPLRKGATSKEILQETTELGVYVEKLGYNRFWLSEHHNTEGVIGSAPEVMIAHIANHTHKIRVGAGGIMLFNYNALKIAEVFHVLEALFPHRIDLGMARSTGSDKLTALHLNPCSQFNTQEFIEKLQQINKYLHNANDKGTVYEKIKAIPLTDAIPEKWLLVSSEESAKIAAEQGMGVSFAHFINPSIGEVSLQSYRANFKPSEDLIKPQASFGIFAFCSEDEDKVNRQQKLMDNRFLQLQTTGTILPISYEDIKSISYSEEEKQHIAINRQLYICGTPEETKKQMDILINNYQVDEVMLATYAETVKDKQESYRLFAEMYNI